jgi:hypothetical protein
MPPKHRRRLIAVITVAGFWAVVWSLRARMLNRSRQEFERHYGSGERVPAER